jgi:hypothetical protein
VKDLKDNILGLGDLKAQKTIMNFASLGLFIGQEFISYFGTGSTQQLKNLKAPPFNFSRSEEVVQLQRNLCIRLPWLLPMQADEYICALTSGKKKGKDEKVGEVIYQKQAIFNASRREDGRVTLSCFSCSRKVNKART